MTDDDRNGNGETIYPEPLLETVTETIVPKRRFKPIPDPPIFANGLDEKTLENAIRDLYLAVRYLKDAAEDGDADVRATVRDLGSRIEVALTTHREAHRSYLDAKLLEQRHFFEDRFSKLESLIVRTRTPVPPGSTTP